MVCMELQYEDSSEDKIVYGDQAISAEEYKTATYDDLMTTQSKEEDEVKYTVAQQANDSVLLERKRRCLSEDDPNKKSDDYSQSDAPINKMSTANSRKRVAKSVDNGDADEQWQYLNEYDE